MVNNKHHRFGVSPINKTHGEVEHELVRARRRGWRWTRWRPFLDEQEEAEGGVDHHRGFRCGEARHGHIDQGQAQHHAQRIGFVVQVAVVFVLDDPFVAQRTDAHPVQAAGAQAAGQRVHPVLSGGDHTTRLG